MKTSTLVIREVADYPGHYEYVHTDEIGNARESSSYYDSREQAIDAHFSHYAWPGGSPIAYYASGAGVVLCAKCAKQDFLESEDGEAWDGQVEDGDPTSTGIMCDGCNEWIVEPVCVECYDELSTVHTPVFWDSSNSSAVCASCMAKKVVDGAAVKSGKRAYSLTSREWYDVNHASLFTA